jgi:hypothetical protein
MKNKTRFLIPFAVVAIAMLSFQGCAKDQAGSPTLGVNMNAAPASVQTSAGGQVTTDLASAAQQALSDFATAQSGNANLTWSLGQAFNAYTTVAKTADDVKALVAQWTASSSTPIAQRIADLFDNAPGTATQKMQTLASAAIAVAGANSP